MTKSIQSITERLRAFAKERDWDQFHSPKNLSMALIVEAGELLEHFQWLSEEQSRNPSSDKMDKIREELADIQLYLLRLADVLEVDLIEEASRKIDLNESKYPAEQVRGSARKYTEYMEQNELPQ